MEYSSIRAKIGMFVLEDTRLQLVYSESMDSTIDGGAIFKDIEYSEYGLDVIQEFDISKDWSILATVGAGLGELELTTSYYPTIRNEFKYQYDYYYLKAGLGLSYQVIDNLEIITGIDYNYRAIDEEIQHDWENQDSEETFVQAYIGINVLF